MAVKGSEGTINLSIFFVTTILTTTVYKPIGYVKSPYTRREDMPRFYTDSGEVTAKLELQPQL